MYDLTSRDLDALASFLVTLYAAHGRVTYVDAILTGLKSLVSCSYTSYNEIDIPARQAFYKSHGIDQALYQDVQPTFKAYLHQHPWGQRVLTTPDYGVRTISDFMPDRDFRRLALYQEYYRPLGISRQLGVSLSVPPALFIPIMINRDGRDYGPRERRTLEVLRPHLAQAFHNAQAWDRLSARQSSLHGLFRTLKRGLLETNRCGKILWMCPGTEDLLRRHRLVGPQSSSYLSSPLFEWLLNALRRRDPQKMLATPVVPLRLRSAGGTLTIHLHETADGARLLIENRQHTPSVNEEIESPLSPRELEVLQLLATARTNDQIALLLGVSRRTVQKHLERVYAKLGVETRTAAAGRLWESTGEVRWNRRQLVH